MFEDTNGVIRNHKSKDIQFNGLKRRTKGQTMRYKTQYRKLKIEQLTRTPLQTGVNSRASEK
jgi:hypothetical protein